MRVVLAEDGSIERKVLADLTAGAGLVVVGEGSRPDALAELVSVKTPDLLVVAVGGDPTLIDDLHTLARTVPTVVLAGVIPANAVEQLASAGVYGVVHYAGGAEALRAAAVLAIRRASEVEAVRAEAAELRDQLESRKLVERAKGILMRRMGLSEPDAFRRLQRASQDENKRMRDIAEAIVHAEKVFGGRGEPESAPAVTQQRRAQ